MRARSGWVKLAPLLIDPLLPLAMANLSKRRCVGVNPCTVKTLATQTRLEPSQASGLLDALTDAGIANRVYKGEALLGWSPARPAEGIGLGDILKAAHQVDGIRLSGTDDQLPTTIRDAAAGVCQGMTLADLSDGEDAVEKEDKPALGAASG